MNYEDIDASLEENIRGDFSSIIGLENNVKNNLINNLQISSDEIPFENTNKPSLDDVIHSDSDIRNIMLYDVVEYALVRDDRINKINAIKVINENDGEIIVNIRVKLHTLNDETNFNLKIQKT